MNTTIKLSLTALLMAAAVTGPMGASPIPCTSGNLSSVVGTTCNIGALTFTFTNFSGNQATLTDTNTKTTTPGTPWSASDFQFNVLSDGFSLGLATGGGTSITAPGGGNNFEASDFADLSYSVADSTGTINGETVNGGGFSASGPSFGQASAMGQTRSGTNNVFSSLLLEDAFGLTTGLEGPGGLCAGFDCSGVSGSPFSTGIGDAYVFSLTALNANTTSWDGTVPTSFTFSTGPLVATPEPSYSVLAGGLLLAVWIARRRMIKERLH